MRFEALTGFRCLAACMVFVYHNRKYWRDVLPGEWLRFCNEMHLGVILFFVLSGFLIAHTYGEAPARSGREYRRYMLIRLARIMPLYWLLLSLYYLDPLYGRGKASWLTYSLCHGFSDRYNLDGITQAWSLTVEMSFYLLAPLLCLLQRKHILWLLCALLSIFVITWATGAIWHRANGNPGLFFYPLSFLLSATFAGHSTQFLAGMLLAAAWKKGKKNLWARMPHKTAVGFLGMLLTIYGIGWFQPDIFHHGYDHPAGRWLQMFVLPVFVVLGLWGLMTERTWFQKFLSSPLMVLLGNASFAFYLVHIGYVNLKIREYFTLPDRNFIVLWVVAILLYLFFEKPLYNRCRKWLLKTPAPTVSLTQKGR